MTLDSLLNGMKSLFSSLGAKTSDSNYGVALLDKTSGEPKGLMGMSDLASVLGAVDGTELTQGQDLNSLGLGKWYYSNNSTVVASLVNAPSGISGDVMVKLVRPSNGSVSQILRDGNAWWYRNRVSSVWGSWKMFYDTSILTNTALLSPLASALGVPTICEDFLAQISDGYPFDRWAIRTIYSNNLSGNYLMKYEVVCSENSTSASDSYFRTYISGSWKSWQRLDNFGCNTPADLASLLGGLRPYNSNISHTTDVDAIKYSCVATMADEIQNDKLPTNVKYGIFYCYYTGGNYPCIQRVLSNSANKKYWRRLSISDEWSAWEEEP